MYCIEACTEDFMAWTTRYPTMMRVLHAVMGAMIIGMVTMGVIMVDMDPKIDPSKWEWYGWHKALGVTLLGLVIWRIALRRRGPLPGDLGPDHQGSWFLAKIVHYGLYAAMIGLPISGIAMSDAGGYPVVWFFGITLPDLISTTPDLAEKFSNLHSIGAWVIVGLVGLHIAGTLKHAWIDRMPIWRRMWF
jgi:cytochrome b561